MWSFSLIVKLPAIKSRPRDLISVKSSCACPNKATPLRWFTFVCEYSFLKITKEQKNSCVSGTNLPARWTHARACDQRSQCYATPVLPLTSF